ncbi:hypothetical protein IEQ34_011893 [Dendrobium chrysotoxum]|uniref:Uncharacterized protein n=1 Tax=Dendrobium chrysotoxum TaxID=161865 RepID=A0AAV7GU57_DENCH|nr:hypothetical protein IEQ34_011893 [Dendrobium chrysotoxum]
MGKRLFSGKVSSLPDNLRCRRSDGRQWRCPQPAKSGLSFCEYHYQQVRRNQDTIKNTNEVAAAAAKPERRLLFTADPPPPKKRRRRRMRKDPSAAAPILSKKMDEGDVERNSSELKLNGSLSLPDKFQHHQFDGREWQCSQPSMPFISFGGRRHLRCKQPNEENNKAIEPKPKRSPRLLADLTPLINRRRQRRLKWGTRAEESMNISEREEGTCDMEAAELAVTRHLPIPDTLRCRRSDGRKWRCTQPAIPGLGFCEHHQMRCKQTYDKNTMVKVAKSDRGFQFPVNPRRSTKQMQRRQMGEQPAEYLMRMKQNKQGLNAAELATSELSLHDKELLCCKEDNSQNDEAEQREKEPETAEYSTPEEMEAVEPATPGLNVSGNNQQCCKEDNNRYKEEAAKPNCKLHFAGDLQPSMKELSLPDHLRCRRSDGRKWRCPQLSMPSVGFCEYHYLQVRRNQCKRKNSKLASGAKRKRGLRLAANQSLARKLRPQRLKCELPGEEQMRTTQKEERDEGMESTNVEVTRDLPNGVMAISPAPVSVPANASPWLHWKIGSDEGYLFERRFRSKNAELVPLVKKLPFSRSVVGRRKKVCHRCRARENKDERRICCLNCQEFFCSTCIETWHSELSELEVKMSCPVCRCCCACINCNSRSDEDVPSETRSKVASCKIFHILNEKCYIECARALSSFFYFHTIYHKLVIRQNKLGTCYDHHLICDLIPLVKQINGEQIAELEIEANNQGMKLLDASVEVAKYSDNEQVYCNNCRTNINDFYRNCSTFCLSCCQKIRVGSLTKGDGTVVCEYLKRRHKYCRVDKAFYGKKVGLSSKKHVNVSALCTSVLPDWTTNKDGSISCPPKVLGGCSVGILNINFAIMSVSAKFMSESIVSSLGWTILLLLLFWFFKR